MDTTTDPGPGDDLSVGLFWSKNIRLYDSVRHEPGFLQRLANTMLKKAFSGMAM
jgi:hypothetical protein